MVMALRIKKKSLSYLYVNEAVCIFRMGCRMHSHVQQSDQFESSWYFMYVFLFQTSDDLINRHLIDGYQLKNGEKCGHFKKLSSHESKAYFVRISNFKNFSHQTIVLVQFDNWLIDCWKLTWCQSKNFRPRTSLVNTFLS